MRQSRIQKLVAGVAAATLTVAGSVCFADNPIIQTKYTADPAPMAYNDTVYLYTSHDEDDATGFKMFNWMLYTSTDMVNWTDHGIIGGVKEPYKTFSWADGDNAWAPQCVARNGKFYLYCPFPWKGQMAIGVAVADSPFGPFKDPLGKPLVVGSYDPTVFIDDDGQAYLYWGGNGPCYYVKLNEDMISVSGDTHVTSIDFTGTPPEASFTEGPWFWRKHNHYYLAWASRCCPEGIGYGMSDSPTGPWKCKGTIMDPNSKSSGNHPGIVDYKGKSYVFGFNYEVLFAQTNVHHERRSICVEQMNYNADGTIVKNSWWSKEGVAQIGTLDPYARTEAETICWSSGVKTEPCSAGGMNVCDIHDGDYLKVKGVDFGSTGASTFAGSVASGAAGGIIELHLDGVAGPLVGSVPVPHTGGGQDWKTVTASVSGATGTHDLYLVFKGNVAGHLFNFDYWQFGRKITAHDLVAIAATVAPYKIETAAGGNTGKLKVLAIYSDGSSKDVTQQATVKTTDGGVKVGDGIVTGLAFGPASFVVSFGGKTDQVRLLVKDLKAEGTVKQLKVEPGDAKMFTSAKRPLAVAAEYLDGRTEDVTATASYANTHPEVASVANGVITARQAGKTTLAVSFKGSFGDAATAQVNLDVVDRDPYAENRASDFTEQFGVQVEDCSEGLKGIGFIENGDWLKFAAVDFGSGAAAFEARVASPGSGGDIQIVLDSLTGPVVGTCNVAVTGGWQNWTTTSCPVTGAQGKHDVYLKFVGKDGFLFNVNWWKFKSK